ncbi:hypothetical protein [Bifidobacterium callitrichidarum]|uniref:hypothetical protein n=1 Tax=Bifidobacterium callitrichidarum TaxID=2052941 RepID=UPI001474D07B|nr:hypothetical protein [Bifidobacterium callitrichidarum]
MSVTVIFPSATLPCAAAESTPRSSNNRASEPEYAAVQRNPAFISRVQTTSLMSASSSITSIRALPIVP